MMAFLKFFTIRGVGYVINIEIECDCSSVHLRFRQLLESEVAVICIDSVRIVQYELIYKTYVQELA